MKNRLKYVLASLAMFALGLMIFSNQYIMPAHANADVGAAAPDFEATDTNGETFKLSDHKGKVVVLEWSNHQCPFVWKHYSEGNMQATQKKAKELGAEWVTIVSSAKGRQGNVSAEEANKILADEGAEVTAKILDESGEIGKMYGAKTTPHMFIIDEEGMVVYAGAIDSNSSPNPKSIADATNYVTAALESLKAGEEIAVAESKPYGCSVKY